MEPNAKAFKIDEFLASLRRALQAQNEVTARELPPLLVQYGELCEAANHRLRLCQGLSHKGHFANAIALAEQEPNLLDRCVRLDITNREVLATAAEILQVSAPALIEQPLVGSLQDTYQRGQAADSHLKQLHRMTLSRAPLPTRLAVMRRLYQQDPNRPFLDADIRTFERAWFKQVRPFLLPFVEKGRPKIIEEALRDLEEAGYLETPPSTLVPSLESLLKKARENRLPTLAQEIRVAYAEQSWERLKALAEEWRSSAQGIAIPHDVSAKAAEGLKWLDAKQSETRTASLRARLREEIGASDSTLASLAQAYSDAERGGAIDDALEADYQRAVDRFKKADVKRLVLVCVAAFAAIVGILWVVPMLRGSAGVEGPNASPLIVGRDPVPQPKVVQAPESPPERDDFDKRVAKAREDVRKLLEAAGRGQGDPAWIKSVAELRKTLEELAALARDRHYPDGDLVQSVKSLDEIGVWTTLATDFRKLRDDLKTNSDHGVALERLADFLETKLTPLGETTSAPSIRHAKLGKGSLPNWNKALEVERLLRSGKFLQDANSLGLASWKDLPPSRPLSSAAQYAGSFRHRTFADSQSQAAKYKQRLGRVEIADLYLMTRKGGDPGLKYYSKKYSRNGNGNVLALVDLEGKEQEINLGDDLAVSTAPQSSFALQASTLWNLSDPAEWIRTVAETHDALLDAKEMDPILRLDLVRLTLELASESSVGYRESLNGHAGFVEVRLPNAQLSGNWLDPKQDLADKRKQAEAFLAKVPKLRTICEAVLKVEQTRLEEIKRGLTACGWISRDSASNKPILEAFSGDEPIAGDDLFTVVEGTWIKLGTVSAKGLTTLVDDTAGEYLGWPIFALPATREVK